MDFRVGFGYDVHAFAPERELMLGGVQIPFEKGLKGHSDADVLLHAITDALLGSLALGDIGTHFPDTHPAYKSADSRKFLKEAVSLVARQGYELRNLDSTIVAERPTLSPYIQQIRSEIAGCIGCDIRRVSVKATTHEKMGALGREEGIAAHAVVLIQKEND